MEKRDIGLFHKFNVYRTDGQSEVGKKHHGCDYFVLDLTHDKHAASAIAAYSQSCREEYPLLANDLFNKLARMESQGVFSQLHASGISQGLDVIDKILDEDTESNREIGIACAARRVFIETTDPAAKDRYQPWEELPPLAHEAWVNVVRLIRGGSRER